MSKVGQAEWTNTGNLRPQYTLGFQPTLLSGFFPGSGYRSRLGWAKSNERNGPNQISEHNAACDVAGAGNGLTVRLVRHSHRKRGETDRPRLRSTAPALDPTATGRRLVRRGCRGWSDHVNNGHGSTEHYRQADLTPPRSSASGGKAMISSVGCSSANRASGCWTKHLVQSDLRPPS